MFAAFVSNVQIISLVFLKTSDLLRFCFGAEQIPLKFSWA